MTSADGAVTVGEEIGSGAMWPMALRGETLLPFRVLRSASGPTFSPFVAPVGAIPLGTFGGA